MRSLAALLLAVPLFGQFTPPPTPGGSGTVRLVATGCGLTGGTITTSGTLSATGPCYAAGGGTAQAQTATFSPAVVLADGLEVCWKPIAANSAAAPTFSPNGLTAHAIVKAGGALVANDITTTALACAVYNTTGTRWELQNPQTVAAGGVTGSGTASTLSKFTGSTAVGDSSITDDGTTVYLTLPMYQYSAAFDNLGNIDPSVHIVGGLSVNELTTKGGLGLSAMGDPTGDIGTNPLSEFIVATSADANALLLNPGLGGTTHSEAYWFLDFNKQNPGVGPSSPALPGLAGDVLISWVADINSPFFEIDVGPRVNYTFMATAGFNVVHPQAAVDARVSDPALPAIILRKNPFESAQTADMLMVTAGDGVIGAAVFSGTGLNDGFFNDPTTSDFIGSYTGATSQTICVKIVSLNPDTITWGNNAGCTNINAGDPVPIGTRQQFLGQGVAIEFAAITGHTIGDKWSTTLVPDTVLTRVTKDGTVSAAGGSANLGTCWKADGKTLGNGTIAEITAGTCH